MQQIIAKQGYDGEFVIDGMTYEVVAIKDYKLSARHSSTDEFITIDGTFSCQIMNEQPNVPLLGKTEFVGLFVFMRGCFKFIKSDKDWESFIKTLNVAAYVRFDLGTFGYDNTPYGLLPRFAKIDGKPIWMD